MTAYKYRVKLAKSQECRLMGVAHLGKSAVRTMKRALALLEEAEGQPDSGGAVDNLACGSEDPRALL